MKKVVAEPDEGLKEAARPQNQASPEGVAQAWGDVTRTFTPSGQGRAGGTSTPPESVQAAPSGQDEPAPRPNAPFQDKISTLTLEAALERAGSETARQILLESVRYSGARAPGGPGIVGATSLTRAALLVGLDERRTGESAPRWLAEWVRGRASAERTRAWTDRPRRPGREPGAVLLSNNAVTALDRAADYARRTVGRSRFDGRHLVAALLTPPSPGLRRAVSRAFLRGLDLDLLDFAPELLAYVADESRKEPQEDSAAWREILLGGASSAPLVRLLPDYIPDRPDGASPDTLGIAAEVQAFAELICLDAAKPPLSIGLFGEWGSGKTFFMEKLQRAIEDICAASRNGAGGGHFISDAVQIRFNAWHYNDANLWACLTAEFFDQLRAGGQTRMQGAVYDQLVGNVADHVRTLESDVGRNEKIAERRAEEVRRKEVDVRQAREALEEAQAGLLPGRAEAELQKTFAARRADLKDLGLRLYGEDLSQDVAAFAAAAKEAAPFAGKVRLIASALLLRKPAVLAVAAALCVIAFAALGDAVAGAGMTAFLQRFAALGGGVFAAAAALWQAYEAARPVLDGASALLKDQRGEREKLLRDLAEKQAALHDALEQEKIARDALDEAKRRFTPFAGDGGAPSHATLLRYFLFEDEQTQDYSKHVGLISRARRSFETLDMLVGRERKVRAARRRVEEARRSGLKPDPDEASLAAQGTGALQAPDRIILYIDDLDRCSHEQVYDVLQAVHLLLAFESFVVIVGVDVRWVELALARHMGLGDGQARNGGDAGLADEASRLSRSRSVDYLEKIFQIPFWLKPLDATGTYKAYVEGLIGRRAAAASFAPPQPADDPATAKDDQADLEPEGEEVAAGPAPEPHRTETFSPIVLTEAEIAFLTSPAIGRIAGASPRAVRRFVNLYRLVRAHRRGPALADFTGESGDVADFPVLAFLLALETGQAGATVDAFHNALAALPDGESVATSAALRAAVETAAGPRLAPGAFAEALSDVDAARRMSASAADFRAFAAEARRYSFHRIA